MSQKLRKLVQRIVSGDIAASREFEVAMEQENQARKARFEDQLRRRRIREERFRRRIERISGKPVEIVRSENGDIPYFRQKR